MTTVTFHSEDERIISFSVSGHSGYADAGSDIVCASVSTAVNVLYATINEVLGLAADFKVCKSGDVIFHLPGGLSDSDETVCQSLLAGVMSFLTDLHTEYPDFVEVLLDDPGDEDDEDGE